MDKDTPQNPRTKIDDNFLIAVGTVERPASSEDLQNIRELFKDIEEKYKDDVDIVTHHAFYIIPISAGRRIYKIGTDDEVANDDDIKELQEEITNARREKRPIVFYHYVQVEVI